MKNKIYCIFFSISTAGIVYWLSESLGKNWGQVTVSVLYIWAAFCFGDNLDQLKELNKEVQNNENKILEKGRTA